MAARDLERGYVDVQLDFLAKPDGPDARAAIQDAIDSRRKGTDALEVYLPAGRWYIGQGGPANGLRLRSTLRLRGAGLGKTILVPLAGVTMDELLYGDDLVDVAVQDLSIDMAGLSAGHGRCITIEGARRVTLESLGLLNTRDATNGHAVLFATDPATDVWVRFCYMAGLKRCGVRFAGALAQGLLHHNRVITDHTAAFEYVAPGLFTDELNIVTEAGVTRITGSGAAPPGAWQTLTLDSGWTSVSGRPAPAYYFDAFGRVHLRGEVRATTGKVAGNRIAAGLPLPDTPSGHPLEFRAPVELVHIETDGELVFQGPGTFTGTLKLNQVSYRKL